MRLGVSYNVFDGEELLEGSINCIREEVDYISVVYQLVSNFGNKAHNELINTLTNLYELKLIDELVEYKPHMNNGSINEIIKRNIGLNLSINAKCSHHMSMDTDEYYITSEYKRLKELIIENDYDSTFSQMLSYYKTSEYILDPPEEYYVPLIYKIRDNISYIHNYPNCPVTVDPTRIMDVGKYCILPRNIIQMHHLSMVRSNLLSKLENSSSKSLFIKNIPDIIKYYEDWCYPMPVLWPSNPPILKNVIKTRKFINNE